MTQMQKNYIHYKTANIQEIQLLSKYYDYC